MSDDCGSGTIGRIRETTPRPVYVAIKGRRISWHRVLGEKKRKDVLARTSAADRIVDEGLRSFSQSKLSGYSRDMKAGVPHLLNNVYCVTPGGWAVPSGTV
jgi:hypothetical protein